MSFFKKCFWFLINVLCGLIVIDSNVYAYEDLGVLQFKTLSYGLSETEINLLDIGLKESLILTL